MTQEMLTTLLSIVSSLFMGIMGFLLRRFVKEYDDKHLKSDTRITEVEDEIIENNKKICDRVLTIEQKIPNIQLANSTTDKKLEDYNKIWSAKQTEIIAKLDSLVSKESWGELRGEIKDLSTTLNKFLIAQGEINIKIANLEKANDELFRIYNNKNLKGE